MRKKIVLFLLVAGLLGGCEKQGYNYDKYLNHHEVVYPGLVANLSTQPGYLREQISWTASADRSISRYVIYYNNRKDSLMVKAKGESTSDTIRAIVPDLREYVQDFAVFTIDSLGNRSIGQILTAVNVYGLIFQSALRNRQPSFGGVDEVGNPLVNLSLATDTINVITQLIYMGKLDKEIQKLVDPEQTQVILTDWKEGTDILVRSGYIPRRNAIDTFWVTYSDTLKSAAILHN